MAQAMHTNRRDVIDDLVATEFKYVNQLRVVENVFINPLRKEEVLPDEELEAIFRTWSVIKDVHGQIQELLQIAAAENIDVAVERLCAGLLAGGPTMRSAYLPYVRDHAVALQRLRAAFASERFASFVRAVLESDDRVRGAELEQLLQRPNQRLQELQHTMATLTDLTSEDGPVKVQARRARDLFADIVLAAAGVGASRVPTAAAPTSAAAATPAVPSPAAPAEAAPAAGSGSSSAGRDPSAAGLAAQSRSAFQATPATATAASALPLAAPSFEPGVSAGVRASDEHQGVVSEAAVATAQAEAAAAERSLDEHHDAERSAENRRAAARAIEQRAEAAAAESAAGKGSSQGLSAAESSALEAAMARLEGEEQELYRRLAESDKREVFEAFLSKKRELQEEEDRLTASLAEMEETLAQVRARLANPPDSVLPQDQSKATLYRQWKQALAEREELLREARRRKHELLGDLKARHETQIVLLEMERRSAVEELRRAVETERSKANEHRAELQQLDSQIEGAQEAMKRFREEFEQLRVALLIDRMAKSSQVATLTERRRRLEQEQEEFRGAVEAARRRVAAEEAGRWEERLRAEREAGEQRLEQERARNAEKIARVREAMAEQYQSGFRPLLEEARRRHEQELQRVTDLKQQLEGKEEELRHAQAEARRVAAIPDDPEGALAGLAEGEPVPEWRLQEFEELKRQVAELWEDLDIPEEDVAAFLSECEMMAPFHPQVLEMYTEMHRRLLDGDPALVGALERPTDAIDQRNGKGAGAGRYNARGRNW